MKPEIKLAKLEELEWWLKHLGDVVKALGNGDGEIQRLSIERSNHFERLKKQ
jgi:hypothetical protein